MTYTDNCPKLKIAVPDTISYYIEIYRLKTCALEGLGELCVGIPAVVGRCPLETQAVIDDVASVRSAKTAKHELPPIMATMWGARQRPAVAWMLQVGLLVVKSRSLHESRHW